MKGESVKGSPLIVVRTQNSKFSKSQNHVNSQSKFHSRKAVEISMRNQWKLVWEKEEKKQERGTKAEKS